MDHEAVLARVVAWADEQENIRALVLTGSVARGGDEVDELSDLDIEVYARRPEELLDDDGWHSRFGTVLVVEALPNPGWHPTRLLYLEGGKIDVMIAPVGALATSTYTRLFRVLMDKDGATGSLREVASPAQTPPSPAEYLEAIHHFYAGALMCAKLVVRDEPWLAKLRDWDMKRRLLQMVEWDHRARYGWTYDTWYGGKLIERWADANVLDHLEGTWTGYDARETARGLTLSCDLFSSLSDRTAAWLRLPRFEHGPVRREIAAILALRPEVSPSAGWADTI